MAKNHQSNKALPPYLSFWGKAKPSEDADFDWHPLAYHSLDVAATGKNILKKSGQLRHLIASALCLDEDSALALCTKLFALHDIGKFSKGFQVKNKKLYGEIFCSDPSKVPSVPHHDTAGWIIWRDEKSKIHEILFQGQNTPRFDPLDRLAKSVFGHHGMPPREAGLHEDNRTMELFGEEGCAGVIKFLSVLQSLLEPSSIEINEKGAERASFLLAGLTVLSDWIGSNQNWFPYTKPGATDPDCENYWKIAEARANDAVIKAGVIPARPTLQKHSYIDLINGENKNRDKKQFTATSMQETVERISFPNEPTLFIIEDATGSGKTETALMLSHRLIAEGRANGLYVGLPTQATANAMFDRFKGVYENLFDKKDKDKPPSLALAHSARDLHKGFQEIVLKAGPQEDTCNSQEQSDDEEPANDTASAQCAAWIADNRKKTFLADVGVGTIDQALLSVLPVKHQSLRLAGLAQKVLILDEVHAYDAYVRTEIEALLEFQAALGGNAILLSATLPREARQRFSKAWQEGLGNDNNDTEHEAPNSYPLLTVVSARKVQYERPQISQFSKRQVKVTLLPKTEDAICRLKQASSEGLAAVYIRNTVDDAIDAWTELRKSGYDPWLFHARMALGDRLRIEREIQMKFGKASSQAERAGKILIATQVVEQSLDLDFDFMVSDLAPVDLLIQRAGRLWRHQRNRHADAPELFVVSPDPIDEAAKDWFEGPFRRASYVYKDHGHLWLTARMLKDKGLIRVPEDMRALVDEVYSGTRIDRIPDELRERTLEEMGDSGALAGMAKITVLPLSEGYVRGGTNKWSDEVNVTTRLSEPMVTLRLARETKDNVIEPWISNNLDSGNPNNRRQLSEVQASKKKTTGECIAPEHKDAAKQAKNNWRLSEVQVPKRRITGECIASEHKNAAEQAKNDWTKWEQKNIKMVILCTGKGEEKVGEAKKGEELVSICYNKKKGLEYVKQDESI